MAKALFRYIYSRYALAMALAFALLSPVQAADMPGPPSEGEAPIALLIDLGSGQVLFEREADRRFIPASMTKVMTAFLAFEKLKDGSLSLDQHAAVMPQTFAQWSRVGSTMFIPHDAAPTVAELLMGVTTISANDASIILVEHGAGSVARWVEAMNGKARMIGLRNSRFGTPNGWMDGGKTFTTARDLGLLGAALIERHPQLYARFFGNRSFTYNGITQANYDPVTGVVQGADGIKTGFTNQAGHGFLGSAERQGQRLVMVIAGAPSNAARIIASRQFLEWGFAQFRTSRLFENGDRIGEARVQGGDVAAVALVTTRPVDISLPRNGSQQPVLELSISYNGPLRAPIEAGEEVARLIISLDGKQVNAVPLASKHGVGEANSLRRVLNGFTGWFT